MPWLELSLHCQSADEPWLEQALNDVGAISVTLLDADAQTPDERAILEPGVGQTPLWNECIVTALFAANTPREALLAALESIDPRIELASASFRDIEDQDWERAWLDQFKPIRFGQRTWIVPWNQPLPDASQQADAAIVQLDPGLAFGSGTHPTTALCLDWLDSAAVKNQSILDFGCGSGILAIAALKLGATGAVCVDNDPQALTASIDNAQRNQVADRLQVFLPTDEPVQSYPIVLANILASALQALVDVLSARVQVGGYIVLSGILRGQETELIDVYQQQFEIIDISQREDWLRIVGRKLPE